MTEHADTRYPTSPSADLRARSLDLLEFPRVCEALASHTHLPLSREQALSLTPAYEAGRVRELQAETAEALLLLEETGGVDLTLAKDPRPLLQRASMQGVLAGDELVVIADALDLVRKAKALGGRLPGKTPVLRNLARFITDLRPLERELRDKLTPSGELQDDATPYLRQLRQESREAYRRATRSLETIAASDAGVDILQDRVFTVRGDRLVLPVKADFRGRLPGIVHDVSDSGATLFVEPFSSVALTNTWREASAAEQEEVLRILRQLSNSVARRVGDINHALEMTARIDLALAKARYSRSYHGEPVSVDGEQVRLVEARHPLLTGAVVPVSLTIAPPVTCLVITGPNTGGKTVALKTLGLMVLMQQCGLQLPCNPATELPLVDAVYADIGDQQSIQEAVSTFSSHVRNIAAILTHATERSLVLLDELGTSTDPEEGAALAQAILAHLASRQIPALGTTHHRAVAEMAERAPEMENASVELDPNTLRPTYRVTMGLPGRSYALAVAERIGLDPAVVETAKGLLDPKHREAEALLASIQEERHRTRQRLQEAEQAERRAADLARELEAKLQELEEAQARVVDEVRLELQAEARQVQSRLRQAESAASWEALREEPPPPRVIEDARGEVADVQRMLRSRIWGKEAKPAEREGKPALAIGDTVEIGSLGFTGKVLTDPDDDSKVEVLVGSARIRTELSRLRKKGAAPEKERVHTSVRLNPSKALVGAEQEVDLRGLRLHDALERLDGFLDQALAQGVSHVRIIHGKGTGALRQGVWRHLATHSASAGFDFAPRDRGGDGATELELA
ncbi:MAG: endonuclease MutS2 [Dehalococcoidia bacterium]